MVIEEVCAIYAPPNILDLISSFAAGTIRYDSVYLMCNKKLTGSQLSLPHENDGINKKSKCETKNKMMRIVNK